MRKYWAAAAVAVALALVPAAAANADDGSSAPPNEQSAVTSTRMKVVDFDEDVAKTNGFEIVTDEQGIRRSVPVTDAARTAMAQAESRSGMSPAGVIDGDCGKAWIDGSKSDYGDWVSFTTGYCVYLPVTHRNWEVVVSGFVAGFVWPWPSASTGPVWSSSGGGTAVGPGPAYVPSVAANVVLTNGSVCYSRGPSFWFP